MHVARAAFWGCGHSETEGRAGGLPEGGREPSPLYSRVHTCTGAEARLSVGRSCPPGPLRAFTQMAYLLPGSKALWGREARERDRMALLSDHGSARGSSRGRWDTGGGLPGLGVTQVGVVPGPV